MYQLNNEYFPRIKKNLCNLVLIDFYSSHGRQKTRITKPILLSFTF